MAFTFDKKERLSRKTYLAQLFVKGNPAVKGFPFRFSWVDASENLPFPVQIVFPVSKRLIPKATQRNRIRRQMRELYRLHKEELYNLLRRKDQYLFLSMSYLANQSLPMKELKPLFEKAFTKLLNELEKHT